MVGCIGGRVTIERDVNQPIGTRAARRDLVVCRVVLGVGGGILPGLLWGEGVFEAAYYWPGAAAVCMAARIARERVGDWSIGIELGKATWLA